MNEDGYIITASGRTFHPMRPHASEVDFGDIAHALSMLCRWNGHTSRFYSVAEHCVRVSGRVRPRDALWGLLHDAAEAYIGDTSTPVKKAVTGLAAMEHRLLDVIAEVAGLDMPLPHVVRVADRRMLVTEAKALMPGERWRELTHFGQPYNMAAEVLGWAPGVARQAFLRCLNRLITHR